MLHRQAAHYWISIHALLAESDPVRRRQAPMPQPFLSTLSLRRATCTSVRVASNFKFLSTLSLRRATVSAVAQSPASQFLSTLSLRRATGQKNLRRRYLPISIHALLAESDLFPLLRNLLHHNFYPRSPCGERLNERCKLRRDNRISIHALLAESDNRTNFSREVKTNFYPRSPCGERPLRQL